MMSLWDALRMNMMISYQELVRTFPSTKMTKYIFISAVLYLTFILLGIWIGLMLGTYIYNCNY